MVAALPHVRSTARSFLNPNTLGTKLFPSSSIFQIANHHHHHHHHHRALFIRRRVCERESFNRKTDEREFKQQNNTFLVEI